MTVQKLGEARPDPRLRRWLWYLLSLDCDCTQLLLAPQDRRDAGAVQAVFLLRSSGEDGAEVLLTLGGSHHCSAVWASR